MKLFPIVCLVTVLLFYLTAYFSLTTLHASPPPRAAIESSSAAQSSWRPTPAPPAAALGVVRAAEVASVASTSPPPPALKLDGTLDDALRVAVPSGKPKFVLVTFGNLGVREQLVNFVTYCQRAGAAHVVGAVDEGAFDLMLTLGAPTYKTPLVAENYRLDGSNQHSSGSWKRFAGMRTGEVRKVVHAGYTVLHTDCDIVFLRDPAPYLTCDPAAGRWDDEARYPCAGLRAADVAVSSDNMSPDRDHKGHAGYSAGGTFNTGLLLVRATPGGLRFVDEWHRLVVKPDPGSRFAALTSDQQVFNHMMRKEREWPGISAPQGAWVMEAWDKSLSLGALPLTLFQNGHGYFVQASHTRLGISPIAVHATYSLDNHDALAKAQRFREAGLWQVEPAEYYQGKYLALNHSIAPDVQAAIDRYVQRGEKPSNIDVHRRSLAAYVHELRDALALARALGRTLILPRWTCYCDRLWSGSDDIFHFGCMYPGAQDGNFVPFVCPMDHVLSPTAWAQASVPYRDAAFLQSPQRARAVATAVATGGSAAGIAELQLVSRQAFDALAPAAQRTALPLGTTDAEAKALLSKHGLDGVGVLRLPHARGLLCGLESAAEASELNKLAARVLRVPQWCAKCYQPCAQELARWIGADGAKRGGTWGGGGNFFCLDVPVPPAFVQGSCVLNSVAAW